jgi:predicted GNAT family acetyltransferase
VISTRRCPDGSTFLAEAGPFLVEREAEHNLILGLCSRIGSAADPAAEHPYLGVAVEDDRIVAAALRTPPMNVILSESERSGTAEAFALDALERYGSLPGVLGPCDGASAFAQRWTELTGVGTRRVMRERIFRAQETEPAPDVPGSIRPAGETDRELLLAWLGAFVAEAFPEDIEKEPVESIVRRRLNDDDGGLLFWEVDGTPVSLAGFGGTTPNGIRIGPVYTPPEHRRRGFAQALVYQQGDIRRTANTAFILSTATSILLAAALILAAPRIGMVFHKPDTVLPIRLMALAMAISGATTVPLALLDKGLKFRLRAVPAKSGCHYVKLFRYP